ncbi:MAG TPA: hypothetical protein VJ346_08785 [Bacteroidales bacterium]|nr:hypothetical protein [Bacteroidales bacterium]
MNRFTVLLAGLLISGVLQGQEQLKHERKIYVAPDGKMYINKSLPIYLRIAASPDENAKTWLLHSEVTTKYSNPMYLDTEGYNTFRSPSAVDTVTKTAVYPLQDIIFEVYSDSKAPVTTISFGDAKTYSKEDKLYVDGTISLTLKATDLTSGPENIYYSIDNTPYVKYADPLKLENEKQYDIRYYAVDNVGNVEELHKLIINIDKSSPASSYEVSGDFYENMISGNSKIILKSEDAAGIGIDNIYYKIDDSQEKKYVSPILATYLTQGDHKITFHATDKVNNTEKENVFEFYVDKTPPVIVQEILGKSFFTGGKEYSSGRSQLKLTTLDNKAGIKEVWYSLNEGEYKKYDRPVYLTDVTGRLTVKAYALDNVNNKSVSLESGDKTAIPYVDLTGPNVKHGFSGPVFAFSDTVFVSRMSKILLTATDSESGLERIEYRVDDDSVRIFKGEFAVEEPGIHNVYFTGYDNVENTSSSQFVLIVDNTGPEIFATFSINPTGTLTTKEKILDVYAAHVVLFLSSTDDVVGFDQLFYSVNNGQEKSYAGGISHFPAIGEYKVKIRARDKLGNETTKEIAFFINE